MRISWGTVRGAFGVLFRVLFRELFRKLFTGLLGSG